MLMVLSKRREVDWFSFECTKFEINRVAALWRYVVLSNGSYIFIKSSTVYSYYQCSSSWRTLLYYLTFLQISLEIKDSRAGKMNVF